MTTSHLPTEITVADAAERLGVSERTVWRYLKSEKLTGRTVGEAGSQRTLIDVADVDRIASERGRDPRAAELRAERDRLAGELERLSAERDRLQGRVTVLQRAAARPGESLVDRIAGAVLLLLSRLPARVPAKVVSRVRELPARSSIPAQ